MMKKNSISKNIKDPDSEKKSIQYQIPLNQDPKKIEKELGEFLNKKFGGNVKIITPSVLPKRDATSDRPA